MKNITHYFIYVGSATQTKNRLQKDFMEYLESLKGDLIDAKNINKFRKQIIDKSVALNKVHSRCTPLEISYYNLATKVGVMISGFPYLNFQIIAAAYHEIN